MFKRLYALIIKEFLAIWQDKKSRVVLIVPPMIQLCVFAFAATLDVKNVSIAVLNRDEGKLSYELVQRFQGSPVFNEITYLRGESEIRHVIDTQKVSMVLQIDEQFSRNLLAHEPATIQLILDGRKSNSTQIIQGYAAKIVDQYNQDLARQWHLPVASSVLVQRNWFNSNLLYPWFTVPGLIGILTTLITLTLTSLSIARERELGTFEQILVSPLRPIEILIGKAVPVILIGMAEGSMILIAAVLLFQIPFTGSLLALYLAMFFFICSIAGIGLFLSSLSNTQQQALLSVFVFMSPAVALSGFATPVENMPDWLQVCTLANPLRFFLVIVRGLFLKDLPMAVVLENTYPIALIALFTLTASTWFFRTRLE